MNSRQFHALVLCTTAVLLVLGGIGCQSTAQKGVPKQRQYSFWPPAPDEPQVQFLTTYDNSADITPAQSRMDEVLYGHPKVLAVVKPYGVAMWQGKIYVCDVRSKGLTILDLRQKDAKVVGVAGSVNIGKAVDIAVASDGTKYVADAENHAIILLDAQDHIVQRFAPKEFNPVSVAVYGDELFVADFLGQTVKVFNRHTGEYLRKIGEGGNGDGQFVRPLAVRVDNSGIVFVEDVITARMQRFDRNGKFLSTFGQAGNHAGDLVRPKHFAFDKKGDLYIADAAFNNVQVFDEQQMVAGYFGSPGTHPGAMDLPAGVFVDEDPADLTLLENYVHPAFQAERLILVTNQFGTQRVSVYAAGHLKPGKTLDDIAALRGNVAEGIMPTTAPTTQGAEFMTPARASQPAIPRK